MHKLCRTILRPSRKRLSSLSSSSKLDLLGSRQLGRLNAQPVSQRGVGGLLGTPQEKHNLTGLHICWGAQRTKLLSTIREQGTGDVKDNAKEESLEQITEQPMQWLEEGETDSLAEVTEETSSLEVEVQQAQEGDEDGLGRRDDDELPTEEMTDNITYVNLHDSVEAFEAAHPPKRALKKLRGVSPERHKRAEHNLRHEIAVFYSTTHLPKLEETLLAASNGTSRSLEITQITFAPDMRFCMVFWDLPLYFSLHKKPVHPTMVKKIEWALIQTRSQLKFFLGSRLKSRRVPGVRFTRSF